MAGEAAINYVKRAIEQAGTVDYRRVSKTLEVIVKQDLSTKKTASADKVFGYMESIGICTLEDIRLLIELAIGRRPVRTMIRHYDREGQLLRVVGGDRDIMGCTW